MAGHALCAPSYLTASQCQLASPSLRERNKSCLSKHILLPNFLCSGALASRCVLSVPFPELAYNRTQLPPVQDAACGKEKNSPISHLHQTFQQLFPLLLSPCVGRIFKPCVHDHKKVQILCWWKTEVQTKVQLLLQCEAGII